MVLEVAVEVTGQLARPLVLPCCPVTMLRDGRGAGQGLASPQHPRCSSAQSRQDGSGTSLERKLRLRAFPRRPSTSPAPWEPAPSQNRRGWLLSHGSIGLASFWAPKIFATFSPCPHVAFSPGTHTSGVSSSSLGGPSHVEFRLVPATVCHLNQFSEDPVSKGSHALRQWGIRVSTSEFEGHNALRNTNKTLSPHLSGIVHQHNQFDPPKM